MTQKFELVKTLIFQFWKLRCRKKILYDLVRVYPIPWKSDPLRGPPKQSDVLFLNFWKFSPQKPPPKKNWLRNVKVQYSPAATQQKLNFSSKTKKIPNKNSLESERTPVLISKSVLIPFLCWKKNKLNQ